MFATLEGKALALLAAAIVAFSLGWLVNGWRLNDDIETMKAQQARALAQANADVAAKQAQLDAAQQVTATTLSKIDTSGTAALKGLQDENDKLRASVAAGTQRVYVHATCPAVGAAAVPQAPASGGVDPGAAPGLTADAQQGYLDLVAGIPQQRNQLVACQAAVRALTGQ